jgi:hypothetical protein
MSRWPTGYTCKPLVKVGEILRHKQLEVYRKFSQLLLGLAPDGEIDICYICGPCSYIFLATSFLV